jgi:hypothetical protein
VTHLRKTMLGELERRNYSQSTVRTYLMTISADICNHLTSRRLIDLTVLRLHQTPYDW